MEEYIHSFKLIIKERREVIEPPAAARDVVIRAKLGKISYFYIFLLFYVMIFCILFFLVVLLWIVNDDRDKRIWKWLMILNRYIRVLLMNLTGIRSVTGISDWDLVGMAWADADEHENFVFSLFGTLSKAWFESPDTTVVMIDLLSIITLCLGLWNYTKNIVRVIPVYLVISL